MILELMRRHAIDPKFKCHSAGRGEEYHSPCPACGGKDRFRVWPEQGERGTWHCRQCDKGGDAIEFLRVFDGMGYGEACKYLGMQSEYKGKGRSLRTEKKEEKKSFEPKAFERPQDKWQEKAAALLKHAQENLLQSPATLAWLEKRGIDAAAAQFFGLGLLPGEKDKQGKKKTSYYRARSAWGLPEVQGQNGKPKKLWIPRGLVIPAFSPESEKESGEKKVLRLRIRRPDADRKNFLPDLKYFVLPGSSMAPLLISDAATKAYAIQEAELDAMATAWAAKCAGLTVGALSVGTNMGKPDAAAHNVLQKSLCILVSLDFDAPDAKGNRPGAQGAVWWKETYTQAKRWPVAMGKDVGEAVEMGMDVGQWLEVGLPPALQKNFGQKSAAEKGQPQEVAAEENAPQEDVQVVDVTPSVAGDIAEAACDALIHDATMPTVSPIHGGPVRIVGRPSLGAHIFTKVSFTEQWLFFDDEKPLKECSMPPSMPRPRILRRYFAGKALDENLLVPCPKNKENGFERVRIGWGCFDCAGHERCLFLFVTSKQMLAPKVEKKVEE